MHRLKNPMTFEPLLWSHHPPHLENIAFSTEVGVQRKVVFVPQNGCTDIMEIPQRMYEELNRRQVEQLSAICLVEACNACRDSLCIGKKAPSIWLGAWSFMPAVEMQWQRLFVHVFIVQPFHVMIFHIPTQAADVISIWIGSGHWHLAVWVFRSLKLAEAG